MLRKQKEKGGIKIDTKKLNEEFDRVADLMIEQNRLEEIFDAIPYLVKQEIVRDYQEKEERADAEAADRQAEADRELDETKRGN